jgi:hypothetical protein
VCSAKIIANFYRRATEAGKFFEDSTKRGILKRSNAGGYP